LAPNTFSSPARNFAQAFADTPARGTLVRGAADATAIAGLGRRESHWSTAIQATIIVMGKERSRAGELVLPGVVLAIAVATPSLAHADRPGEGAGEQWIELAFPDFRYEFAFDGLTDGTIVASFPVPFVLDPVRLGYFEVSRELEDGGYAKCNGYRWFLLPAVIVEPQWQIGPNDLRVVTGARGMLLRTGDGPHLFAEGLGVVGTDGYGGGGGLGIGIAGRASLGFRSLWTTDGQRNDVVLDVHLFGLPMGKYARSVYEAKDAVTCGEYRPPIGLPPKPDPLELDPAPK
jgi:hypothetical protein